MHQNQRDYVDFVADNRVLDSIQSQQENFQKYLGGAGMTKTSFVIELDDSKDLTVLKSILDPFVPANLVILNT